MSNNKKRSFFIRDILPSDDDADDSSDVTQKAAKRHVTSPEPERQPDRVSAWAKLVHCDEHVMGVVTARDFDKSPWRHAPADLVFGLRNLRPIDKSLFDSRGAVSADPLERLRILGVQRSFYPRSFLPAPLPSCNQKGNSGYLGAQGNNTPFTFDPKESIPVPIPLPVYVRTRNVDGDGGVKPKKCRRSRTVFSELQLMGLEKRFETQKYLSTPDRLGLAESLGLTQIQVKTWYQNRRMKWKKQVMQGGGTEAPTKPKPKGRPRKDSLVDRLTMATSHHDLDLDVDDDSDDLDLTSDTDSVIESHETDMLLCATDAVPKDS